MPFSSARHDLKQLMGSLRTTGGAGGVTSQAALPTWPFVTISRQAGAGGRTCGTLLAGMLNGRDQSDHQWQCLDRELVERIAADHHLSEELIDSLETSSHTWVSEFLEGLSLADQRPSDLSVFRRVVSTMRGLARAGHVVLVGLGGAFITRNMPGGVHVRIVAPFEWRVKHMEKLENLTPARARERVQLLDRDREAFFQKFWPGTNVSYEDFHLTLNASRLSEEQMAQCAAAIVPKVREESVIGVVWKQEAPQPVR